MQWKLQENVSRASYDLKGWFNIIGTNENFHPISDKDVICNVMTNYHLVFEGILIASQHLNLFLPSYLANTKLINLSGSWSLCLPYNKRYV